MKRLRLDDLSSPPNQVAEAANVACMAEVRMFVSTAGLADTSRKPASAFIRQASVELDGHALKRVFELRALRKQKK